VGEYSVYVNEKDEARFALVRDINVNDLVTYAKEAQMAAYHAWLDRQIERGEPTAFTGSSIYYVKSLPAKERIIVEGALLNGDKVALLKSLEHIRFSSYEEFLRLGAHDDHKEKVIEEAIAFLTGKGLGVMGVLDALLCSSAVINPGGVYSGPADSFLRENQRYRPLFTKCVNAFVSYLASNGVLLYPSKFGNRNVGTALHPSRYKSLSGGQYDIYMWFVSVFKDDYKMKEGQLRWNSAMIWYLLKRTNVTHPIHLTPLVMRRALETLVADDKEGVSAINHTKSALGKIVQAYTAFLDHFNPIAIDDLLLSDLVSLISPPRPRERVTDNFVWFKNKRPDLTKWSELATSWCASGKVRVSGTAIYGVNHFLDFLAQLEDPIYCPGGFTRKNFVNEVDHEDKKTLWGYVSTLKNKKNKEMGVSQTTKNRVLSSAQELLEFFADQEAARGNAEYIVPISSKDRMVWGRVLGKSVRQALPIRILNRMKRIILSPDASGIPTYAWAKKEKSDWVQTVNRESGRFEVVYYPGRPILLYLLLATPLRGFQARWLDSGELDFEIYSSVLKKMIPNLYKGAIKNKSDGVLRSTSVGFGEDESLGLWINTNKTGVFEPGKIQGYEIPWCDSIVQYLIESLLSWHRKYYAVGASPNPPLVKLYKGEQRSLTDRVFKMMPEFVPLFRDPGAPLSRNRDLPISGWRLRCFFSQVLAETENQFKEEGERLSLVEWADSEVKNLVRLGNIAPATKVTPKVDLHTLRVTGITALIDAGVPAHIVSEFVAGHASVIMTLYYHNHGPSSVRSILNAAYERIESEDFDIYGLSSLYERDPLSVHDYFVTKEGVSPSNTAFNTLRTNSGVATVSHSGICPGANCDEGGPIVDEKATPVPGGMGNCGQCRFWITGPAFLVGQVMEANSLMYHIKNKAAEIKEIRRQLKKARLGGVSAGKINLLAGRAEKAEREITGLLSEWGARYRFIVASNKLLDKNSSFESLTSPENGLITSGNADELRAVARKVSNLEILHTLGTQHQFFPEMNVSEGAIAELEITIAQILARNDMDGLLLRLSSDERLSACNLFAETIIRLTGGDDNAINNILDGSLRLADLNGWNEQADTLTKKISGRTGFESLILKGVTV